jgi:hypothetical protein
LRNPHRRISANVVAKDGPARTSANDQAGEAGARTTLSANGPVASLDEDVRVINNVVYRKKKAKTKPYEPETEKVLEYCWDEFIRKGEARKNVFRRARSLFPGQAPSKETHVKLYARRWAKRFDPPLSMDRCQGS